MKGVREERGIDGHYCMDWDELWVHAWTPEYSCCTCRGRTFIGHVTNWFFKIYWGVIEWKDRMKGNQ